MAKRHDIILQELDPEAVEGFTSAQKQYYGSLGFKPYLNSSGRVKWLRPEQHSLKINAAYRRNFLQRLLKPNSVQIPGRRKHKPTLLKFIRHNWLFILIVIVIAIAVLYLLGNPQIFT